MKRLRLQCPCGRNLAAVTYPTYDGVQPTNPDWTRDGLLVTPSLNVDQTDYRPWDVANRAGSGGNTAARRAATPGHVEDVDYDWHDRTYTWRCRCGQTWTRRHERVSGAWAEWAGAGTRVLVFGDAI